VQRGHACNGWQSGIGRHPRNGWDQHEHGWTYYATGQYPVEIAVGDVNEDGRPDVVTVNRESNSVHVLLSVCR